MDKLAQFLNLEEIVTTLVAFLPRLVVAALVLIAFWVIFRVTRSSLKAILRRSGLEPVLISLLIDKVYRIAVFLFGVVMAASQVGINVTAALAGLGVAGLAVGFAAQDLLANVIAGLTIFLDKPFGLGDYLRVQGEYGNVTNITMRSTRIRTNRNTYVVIPNKKIIDDVVINHSKHGETRIDVPVGIAYKEYIPEARRVLLNAVSGIDGVETNPGPSIVVEQLGGSSVNLLVRVWISDASREIPIFYAVMESSKLALDAAGIQIPFPHLQLFWEDVDDRVVKKFAAVPKLASGGQAAGDQSAGH